MGTISTATRAALGAGILILAACAPPQNDASSTASASAAPAASATAVAVVAAATPATAAPDLGAPPKPLPSGTGSPSPSPSDMSPGPVASGSPASPSPSPTPTPGIEMLPPNASPHISDVALSSTTVQGGDTVTGVVRTSSNVASVTGTIGGITIGVPRVGVGRFGLSYQVPNLPFFMKRTYPLEIVARNTRGDTVSRTVDITIR